MDMLVLQALKVRDRFKALRQAVPKDMFDSTTIGLLNWYALFFDAFPDKEEVQNDHKRLQNTADSILKKLDKPN